MLRLTGLFGVLAFFSLLSSAALAAPGWEVTSFSTSPQNAPKIVAAMDEWMSGSGGDFPGQVTLYANEADGTDPATHTIVVTYPSVAVNEAYGQKVASDEEILAEWMKLMGVFGENATPAQTMRGTFARSWGEADPNDSVWIHHFITAQDAGAVVAAFESWMNSETGKKAPGQVHISGVVAGGMGSPSHIVSIGYSSQAEMETWTDSLVGNADFAAFMQQIQRVTEYHGANLAVRIKTWGEGPAQTASR